MPALQSVAVEINHAFSKREINKLVAIREKFAPGKPLDTSMFVKKGTPLYKAWSEYVSSLPESFQDMLRGVIYHALSTKPATQITFAWAPGYDYELSMWHAPDTRATKGGITVLIKSRYPSDTHPLSK
jgi:hypothetical protein